MRPSRWTSNSLGASTITSEWFEKCTSRMSRSET